MKVLYHASPVKGLKIIEPKKTISKGKYIGDYLFATSDLRLASMYLATKGFGTLMNVKSKKPTIVICGKPKEYLTKDKGGAIYTVPATTFKETPQEGLEESELVSRVAVKPIGKKIYKSSIDAMKEVGIEIYFVNQKVFDDIVLAKDENSIVSLLSPYKK